MAIKVARRNTAHAVYIGRPSPLGNPFVIGRDGDRNAVCDAYSAWLDEQCAHRNNRVINELLRLAALARSGDLILGCYCAPQRCHGDIIKARIEEILRNETEN